MKHSPKGARIYQIGKEYSKVLSISQALVALIGGGLHLLADSAALLVYVEMWNAIRQEYGRRGKITKEAAMAYLWPNLSFILGDLLLDKGLGMVPIAGSVFCYWFAKALTFRLAALFGVLAAMGDDMPSAIVLEQVSSLIQALYPRKSFLFTLADPDADVFIDLLTSMENLDAAQAESRIATALNVLKGEYAIEEEVNPVDFGECIYEIMPWEAVMTPEDEEESSDDDTPDASEVGEPLDPPPFSGPAWAAADEEQAEAEVWVRTPFLLTMKAEHTPTDPRQLLLNLNANGEIEEPRQDAEPGEVVPVGIQAVENHDGAPTPSPAKPTPPAGVKPATPKKKTTAKKKVVAKPKAKKPGNA